VVVIKALEFCKSGGEEVTPMEMGFIDTLADGLGLSSEEFGTIKEFVLNPFSRIPASPNLLIISGQTQPADNKASKYVQKEMLKGQIWILFVHPSACIF